MDISSIRVLIVEDYEPFQRFVVSTLQGKWKVQDIHTVTDGLAAVREAQELQPDLILLDIGLPSLNGFEAARQIRKLSPSSKIIFVTQESSAHLVEEAFNSGACGYVIKASAGSELPAAIATVLGGEHFVSSRLAGRDFTAASNLRTVAAPPSSVHPLPTPTLSRRAETSHRHEVQFYSDEESFVGGFAQFIASGLKYGRAVIFIGTESHRESLLTRLKADGIDITAASDQRRFIPVDFGVTLSSLMVGDLPDPVRLFRMADDLIETASTGIAGTQARVAVCGELAPLLLRQGKPESAVRLEQLWDELAAKHCLDTLCGYSLSSFHGEQGRDIFQRISSQHSAVYPR